MYYTDFLNTDCLNPYDSLNTVGRFFLSENGSVLAEECFDGATRHNFERFVCINGTWNPVKDTETCRRLGKVNYCSEK